MATNIGALYRKERLILFPGVLGRLSLFHPEPRILKAKTMDWEASSFTPGCYGGYRFYLL